jgi:hypothetical protein
MASPHFFKAWSLQFALLFTLAACEGNDGGEPPIDAASDARTPDERDAAGDATSPPPPEAGAYLDAAEGGNSDSLDATSSDATRERDGEADTHDASDAGVSHGPGADDASSLSDASDGADAGDGATCKPSEERCNTRDDDCDGVVDNGCVDGLSLYDFDVTADGAVVAVGHRTGGYPHLVCLRPNGTMVERPVLLAMPEADQLNKPDGTPPSLHHADVARARVAGNIAVSWMYFNWPNPKNDWRVYAAFYDAQCNRVREPAPLDAELPNKLDPAAPNASQIAREATVFMADDGRSYFLYEHQSQQKFRALVFDASGTRTAAVTVNPANECGIGARTRVLALEAKSGKFAVACESNVNNNRIFRRYQADGTAIDASFVVVPDSKPTFTFHYFGLGWNASDALLYYGRVDSTRWITRGWDGEAQLTKREFVGSAGTVNPRTRVTSRGDFLIELPTSGHLLALVSPSGELLRTFANVPTLFELDGQDRLWVHNSGRVYPDPAFVLYP